MKIIDGIKLKGRPAEIPDCGRNDLPEFFKEMGFKVGAEIGVYKGEFLEKFCKTGFKMYGVDPWLVYDNYKKHPAEIEYEDMYQNCKKLEEKYDCKIIRKMSMDAILDIPDNSLDFVYIDSNHSIRYIIEDIFEWNKKVKKGGVICGHDYILRGSNPYGLRACHVRYGVDIMARILGIRNYFILGEKNSIKRDKWRSWLWIKN